MRGGSFETELQDLSSLVRKQRIHGVLFGVSRGRSTALRTLLMGAGLAVATQLPARLSHSRQSTVPAPSDDLGGPRLSRWQNRRLQTLPVTFCRAAGTTPARPVSLDETLRQAETALKANRLEDALDRCNEAVRLDPGSARAYRLLGLVQSRRGAEEQAKEALVQALKLDPSDAASHLDLGKIYLEEKRFAPAASEFQAALKAGDSDGEAHYGLALALLSQSHDAEALHHLRTAVKAKPSDEDRFLMLMSTELRLNQADEVRRNLTEVEELFSGRPWLFYELGKLFLEYRAPTVAQAQFDRSARILEEREKEGRPSQDSRRADLYVQLAGLRLGHHDYAGTLQAVDKIARLTPDPEARATALYLEGTALWGLGKMTGALDKLRQATMANPSESIYRAQLAWAQVEAGDTQAAQSTLSAIRSKWPQLPDGALLPALVERETDPERSSIAFRDPWHLKGEGFVCCPCAVPCPCRSNSRPTFGHCEETGVYRIRGGHYGKVTLDGLTFAMVSSMDPQVVPTALYVPRSTPDEQIIALERVFQSFNPLQPFAFLNVKRVEISFHGAPDDNYYAAEIPGVVQIRMLRQLDSRGEPLVLTAAMDQFSNTIEYGRNEIYKVWNEDGSLRWDLSGRQANFRFIDLDSRDYQNGTMLVQYGDGSGYFNHKQLELIQSLKLPIFRRQPDAIK